MLFCQLNSRDIYCSIIKLSQWTVWMLREKNFPGKNTIQGNHLQ
jgi:hypothetical protein